MKNTKRAKNAEELALVKIENNIENLYNNPAVHEILQETMQNLSFLILKSNP